MFKIPPYCMFLSGVSQHEIIYQANKKSHIEKLKDFFKNRSIYEAEMKAIQRLSRRSAVSSFLAYIIASENDSREVGDSVGNSARSHCHNKHAVRCFLSSQWHWSGAKHVEGDSCLLPSWIHTVHCVFTKHGLLYHSVSRKDPWVVLTK
jgi:hypothetical protein